MEASSARVDQIVTGSVQNPSILVTQPQISTPWFATEHAPAFGEIHPTGGDQTEQWGKLDVGTFGRLNRKR